MPDTLDLGRLRDRVRVQSRPAGLPAPGPAGDEPIAWSDVGTYWACVEPLAGRDLLNAQQWKATIDYRVTLRNVAPIAPIFYRFIYRGAMVLYPESVLRADERDEFLVTLCTFMRGELP